LLTRFGEAEIMFETSRDSARSPRAGQSGFSLVEILVVLAIGGVLAGVTLLSFAAVNRTLQGDAAMRLVIGQLHVARETALTQRRDIEIRFIPPNRIDILRQEIPAAAGQTLLAQMFLESGTRFTTFPGVPDTPDAFGNANPVTFGAANRLRFTPDGQFVDELGIPVNGTVFLGVVGERGTARAVTVFGATARMRSWRWSGAAWEK